MKKLYALFALLTGLCATTFSQEAKQVSECTITYSVSAQDAKANSPIAQAMNGATKTVYIKNTKSRSDLETSSFKQTTLYDSKTDSTVVFKEFGTNKYISYLSGTQRKEKNKKYEGIQFTSTDEKKTILGYDCKKVIAKLADGTAYNVFYTSSIVPANTEYEYQFKSLPGFVMEYEADTEDGKLKVKYTATKITLTPVTGAKFDVPKSGYRVL